MKLLAGALAVLVAGAGLVAAGAPAAARAGAVGETALPLPAYAAMVVDDRGKRVYVSGGPSSNAVLVTDFFGHVKKRIDGQYGASGMALSADGATLYVAQAAGDAISAIDTRTFAERARYPTGARTCPEQLARTGAAIWFGYGCGESWNGGIGRLDTAADPPAVTLDEQQGVRYQRPPMLASDGGGDGPVVAGQAALSLSALTVYSVDGADLRRGATGEVAGSNLSDIGLAPGGASLYSASGSRDHAEAFATGDLAGRGSYHTGAFPNAVAASPDGRHVAAGRRTSMPDDIRIYKVGGSSPVKAFDLGGDRTLAPRGLAWSGTCEDLFVIAQKANSAQPYLRVIRYPTGW
ncbi:hypothetical protein [Spirillospora sp. NPDC029432]|uniref:hypothetical protein n=1 Tax=Spirillospora sp. NPDC029432 TaxID=3154599 RepID=UPI0034535E99